MNDNTLFPYGKHKGVKLIDVEPAFLLSIYHKNICYGSLKKYISDNLRVIEKRAIDNHFNSH